MAENILIAKNRKNEYYLLPKMANRHGLIAGATGTGKTVTLQRIAENFSRIGVPVVLTDVKGDLAGISQPGGDNPNIAERVKALSLKDFKYSGSPVTFWDVFGEQGHPVRTTVSDMGPLLFSRLLNLNETQTGGLNLVFRVADDGGLMLLDLKDLRAMLQHVADNAGEIQTAYGHVSAASIGTIQRALLEVETQGGDKLFGEPALDLDDLIQTAPDGRGMVNILSADRLMQSPKAYSAFLLWFLAELFERLPEVGDPEKPKIVFFFDEAHLLFADVPKALLEKIELIVRLIRSKGVSVFFATQNPLDIPDTVLAQLGNRVQHALRAFTPKDQKVVRAAAQTFRTNPNLDVEKAITELNVGEALVSFLDEKGTPGMVDRALICPPGSKIGPIPPEQRAQIVRQSVLFGHYEKLVDRESAYEMLKSRAEREPQPAAAQHGYTEEPGSAARRTGAGRQPQTLAEAMVKSAAHAMGSQLGRSLIRGVLGSLLSGKR